MALPFPIKPPTITHLFILESNFPVLPGEVSKKNAAACLEKAIQLVDRRIEFVEKQILAELSIPQWLSKTVCLPEPKQGDKVFRLQWTGSLVKWVELIYALHASGYINSGCVSLKNLFQTMGEVFNFETKDFSRVFIDIKSRVKDNRMVFLDELKQALQRTMEDSDRKPSKK